MVLFYNECYITVRPTACPIFLRRFRICNLFGEIKNVSHEKYSPGGWGVGGGGVIFGEGREILSTGTRGDYISHLVEI